MKAKMWTEQWWIKETDPQRLFDDLERMLKGAGFGVLKDAEHYFEPYGYTCLWLLSESHLAVHTFPEEGKSYVELSSCVEAQFNNFCREFRRVYER